MERKSELFFNVIKCYFLRNYFKKKMRSVSLAYTTNVEIFHIFLF